MTGSTPIADWQAARTHPHTYPGSHPTGAFVLVDDTVTPLDDTVLAELLASRGLPPLADRHPVLAYGGNRNPATLWLKLQHYGYRSPGAGVVLPVLPARLRGFDVVGAALSGQGYLYADLYAGPETVDTELAVHVLLLDSDQLRALHDSEGVRSGFYDVGLIDDIAIAGRAPVSALAYLATAPFFVSPATGSPLAFSAVAAVDRRLPAFDALPMLAHALRATGLTAAVAPVVGLPADSDDAELAWALMRYLNGQWWFRRHTGLPRLAACEALEALINERLLANSTAPPQRPRLTVDAAYDIGTLPRFVTNS